MQPKSKVYIFLSYSPTQNAYKCFQPQTKKFSLTACVIWWKSNIFQSILNCVFHNNPTHSRISHFFSFFLLQFSAGCRVSITVVRYTYLIVVSGGPPTIVASSLGDFEPSAPFFHDCLQTLDHNTTHLNFPLHDTQTGPSLNLQSRSHDQHLGLANTSNFPTPTETNNFPQRTHTMTIRSMYQIFKPKQLHTVSKYPLSSTIEPTNVSQAISQPHWREVMSNELTALMKHRTWDIVLPPSNCKPVGCKWVFWVKRKADGLVDRFKVCLVAKGYNQRLGVDYKDTFSLVIKPTTIIFVLSIVVMNGWVLRQLNINNAFLNGELSETVFMA